MMLKSSDGEAVALHSQTIARMVADNEILLEGSILTMVIEYCSTHDASDSSSDEKKEELKKWDADFMNAMKEQSTLFDVMLAAYYLNIKDLVDLSCQTVADMITGKTPDEIRKLLNIENDFTPEEEEELRKEEKSMGF